MAVLLGFSEAALEEESCGDGILLVAEARFGRERERPGFPEAGVEARAHGVLRQRRLVPIETDLVGLGDLVLQPAGAELEALRETQAHALEVGELALAQEDSGRDLARLEQRVAQAAAQLVVAAFVVLVAPAVGAREDPQALGQGLRGVQADARD